MYREPKRYRNGDGVSKQQLTAVLCRQNSTNRFCIFCILNITDATISFFLVFKKHSFILQLMQSMGFYVRDNNCTGI